MVRRTIKQSMRFPNTAMNALTQSDTADFIGKYANLISKSAKANLPPFLITTANLFMMQTPFGSVIDYLNNNSKKNI